MYLGQGGSIRNGRLESAVHRMHRVHRPEARRPYESVIDVLLHRTSCRGRGRRGRRYSGGDQPLLLSRVYLYVLVTVGLHLRPVTLRTRSCPRPRCVAMPITGAATGIVVHGAETHVLVLGTARSRLNCGVVMSTTGS